MIKTCVKVMLVSLFIGGLINCTTTTEKLADTTGGSDGRTAVNSTASDGGDGATNTSGIADGVKFARNAIANLASPLSQKVIYFDYNKSNVLAEYMSVVDNHAQYLSDYPDVTVRLEGHTDERGSREYNIALGEHRATAVRRLLLLQGVAAGQINTLSYGEELPATLAHNEESWALNRRVEFVYE